MLNKNHPLYANGKGLHNGSHLVGRRTLHARIMDSGFVTWTFVRPERDSAPTYTVTVTEPPYPGNREVTLRLHRSSIEIVATGMTRRAAFKNLRTRFQHIQQDMSGINVWVP
jgi:hypothetical protein